MKRSEMIDGEIYCLLTRPNCVFAYCNKGSDKTDFYIGVTSCGEVVCSYHNSRPNHMMSGEDVRLAGRTELARFYDYLKNEGFVWNKANKVVFKPNKTMLKI